MQKLERLYKPNDSDLQWLTDTYLSKGWRIHLMTSVDEFVIFVLEKETRKEKLKAIEELAEDESTM